MKSSLSIKGLKTKVQIDRNESVDVNIDEIEITSEGTAQEAISYIKSIVSIIKDSDEMIPDYDTIPMGEEDLPFN